jgi:hypothetical protein
MAERNQRKRQPVGREDSARRVAREEAIKQAGQDAAEEVLYRLPRNVREYIDACILAHGFCDAVDRIGFHFRDKAYLKRMEISAEGAESVIFGLRAYEFAEERRRAAIQFESSLDGHELMGARLAIFHALLNQGYQTRA